MVTIGRDETPLVVRHADDLDRTALERIAFDGAAVALDDALLARVDEVRARMLSALADGRRVYGVTTAMGYLGTVDLDADAQAAHQRRLLLGRAVGSPPHLPPGEARALVVARLAGFLRGHSGVSAALCHALADHLNHWLVPAVPDRGVGTAGEVQPCAHAFQPLIGEGYVLGDDGQPLLAASALSDMGLQPHEPGAKEGVALLAGAPGAAALAAAALRRLRRLSGQLTVAAACAIDALAAPRSPYDPVLGDLAADPVLTGVLEDLAALAGGDDGVDGHQAPVSYRVIPQVLTHLRRTALRLAEDTDRALAAQGDSPAFVDGRFVTSGAFHAVDLAAGLDALTQALTRAGELAVQRIHRLLDPRVTGLPAQLAGDPEGGCGLVVVHKRAVGAVNELRRLAQPSSIGLVDTALGQEDAQTFTFEAAVALRRAEALVAEIAAAELLCARQAWWLRDARPAADLADVAGALNSLVAPVTDDRPLGADLDTLAGLLADDRLPAVPPGGW